MFMSLYFLNTISTTPVTAPVRFDLAGSEIGFSVEVERRQGGILSMALNPNPAAVTGTIDIEQLNLLTGLSPEHSRTSPPARRPLSRNWTGNFPSPQRSTATTLRAGLSGARTRLFSILKSFRPTLALRTRGWTIPFDRRPYPRQLKRWGADKPGYKGNW